MRWLQFVAMARVGYDGVSVISASSRTPTCPIVAQGFETLPERLRRRVGAFAGSYPKGPGDMERKRAADAETTRLQRDVLPGELDPHVVAVAASVDVEA